MLISLGLGATAAQLCPCGLKVTVDEPWTDGVAVGWIRPAGHRVWTFCFRHWLWRSDLACMHMEEEGKEEAPTKKENGK